LYVTSPINSCLFSTQWGSFATWISQLTKLTHIF